MNTFNAAGSRILGTKTGKIPLFPLLLFSQDIFCHEIWCKIIPLSLAAYRYVGHLVRTTFGKHPFPWWQIGGVLE
jgi:hypothetical protein